MTPNRCVSISISHIDKASPTAAWSRARVLAVAVSTAQLGGGSLVSDEREVGCVLVCAQKSLVIHGVQRHTELICRVCVCGWGRPGKSVRVKLQCAVHMGMHACMCLCVCACVCALVCVRLCV